MAIVLFIAGANSESGTTGRRGGVFSGMPEAVETGERRVTADIRYRGTSHNYQKVVKKKVLRYYGSAGTIGTCILS